MKTCRCARGWHVSWWDEVRWWLYWMRFKHRRRTLEARLFSYQAWGPWKKVREENNLLGVWRRW